MSGNEETAVQTPDISEEYLSAFRKCLRITSTDFDREIMDLVRAARSDLVLGGVWTARARDEADPLIRQAITSYIRAEFGLDNEDADKYRAAYERLKIALVLEAPGADYHGETRVELEGRLYEVVRTYTRNGEKYELNCKQAAEPPQDGTDRKETA